MSKPIINAPTTRLTLSQRLPLVASEVKVRAAAYPKNQQNHIRAKCWVSWINKNILEVAHVNA